MEVRIKIGNSTSFLSHRLPHDIQFKINTELSYFDQSKFFLTKNKKQCFENLFDIETNSFPTGLTRRLCQVLVNNGFTYKIYDERKKPDLNQVKFKCNPDPFTAYPDQIAAIDSAVNSPSGRGIIVLPTGVGKTFVMKELIRLHGVRTLVIEPGLNLKRQVADYFESCFGSSVGYFDRDSETQPDIAVANLDSLSKATKENLRQFDMVLFDEYHHEACVTARTINQNLLDHVYFKFALTATNFRNNQPEQILLDSVLGNELYSLSPLEAIRKGYIVGFDYMVSDIQDCLPEVDCGPFSPSEDELHEMWDKQKNAMKYHKVYKQFIVNHEERNAQIILQANQWKEQGIPTLILVKEVEHGRMLQAEIEDSAFITGQNKKEVNFNLLNDFNSGEIPIAIGTSVIGEGIDTKRAGAVILGNAEKAESKIMQNIGRIVRNFSGKDKGLVRDFNDLTHKTVKKHSKQRKKTVKKHFGIKALDV